MKKLEYVKPETEIVELESSKGVLTLSGVCPDGSRWYVKYIDRGTYQERVVVYY